MDDVPVSRRDRRKDATRRRLLQAATKLAGTGGSLPSLEQIGAEAGVSRATTYRYFPSADSLLAEAAVDVSVPTADALFADDDNGDIEARLLRVEQGLHAAMTRNDAALRMLLIAALQRGIQEGPNSPTPLRQNRRTPLIDAALAPARGRLRPATLRTLARAMALLVGPEAMLVFRDVLRLDDREASRVKRWMIRALVVHATRGDASA